MSGRTRYCICVTTVPRPDYRPDKTKPPPGVLPDGAVLISACHRLTTDAKKPIRQDGLLHCLMPGSSLLSHGETPHYHRRYGVSLLSSAWGQVGPPRYSRQANSFVLSTQYFIASAALAAFANVSHILLYAPSVTSFAALPLRKLLRTTIRYQD